MREETGKGAETERRGYGRKTEKNKEIRQHLDLSETKRLCLET